MFSKICAASKIYAEGCDEVLKNTSKQLKSKGYSEEKLNIIHTAFEDELKADLNLRLKRLALLEAKHKTYKAHSGEAHECNYTNSKNVGCNKPAFNKHEGNYYCDTHYKAAQKENCGFAVEGGNFCKIKASKKFTESTIYKNKFDKEIDFKDVPLCTNHYNKISKEQYVKCKKVVKGVRCSNKAKSSGFCEDHEPVIESKKEKSDDEESEEESEEEDDE